MSLPTHYEILGITSGATNQDIRMAFKKMTLIYHPDRAAQNNLTTETANAAFKLVNEAYETLSNPQLREEYDRKRARDISSAYSVKPTHFDSNTIFIPESLSQEINEILEKDSGDILEQFLNGKDISKSLLQSILYYACCKGKFNIVKHLIEVRKLNAKLEVDNSPIFAGPIFKAAAESGNLDLVKYLFETHHVDIESQGLSLIAKDTALSRAAEKGHELVVHYLISKGANLNSEVTRSIIYKAIESGKLSVVRLLVEAGSKIDGYHMVKALETGSLSIVQFFLQKKPNIKSYTYYSVFAHRAIASGNVELVKFLEREENLDIFANCSVDKLLYAAAKSDSIEMMKFLLDEKGLNEIVSNNIKYIRILLNYSSEALTRFLIEERKFILPKEMLDNS